MKVCANCEVEIGSGDGDNLCSVCDRLEANNQDKTLRRRRQQEKWREDALRSCGLVKVRGALGGVYWE